MDTRAPGPTTNELKLAAARRAVDLVRPGMVLGIGTGTTARYFIQELGRRAADGLAIAAAVPTSRASAALAEAAGIPLAVAPARIDLAVDGADEIDPRLNLVKGHGGALFREKMVAAAADRFVVIADQTKLVDRLGRTFVPVEVAPFLWRHTFRRLEALGARCSLRGGEDDPYQTDNDNVILDLVFAGGLAEPETAAAEIKATTGVLEHGLFLGMADAAIVAGDGGVRLIGGV